MRTTRSDILRAVADMEEGFEANSGFFYSEGGPASCFHAMRSALKTIADYLTEDMDQSAQIEEQGWTIVALKQEIAALKSAQQEDRAV